MSAFEHVATLLSFVYALALAHLLSRVGELIVARERVVFSGLLAIAMVNAALFVFSNWIQLWDVRSVASWDLASITIQFLFAIAIFLICVIVGPKLPETGPFELDAYFWRQRVDFYIAMLVTLVLSMLANAVFLKTANVALFFRENLLIVPFLVPVGLGIAFRARWVQWVAGLGLMALTIGFTIVFDSTLG